MSQLLELEHRGWQALCESTGADFYGSIMTADGLIVLANGVAMDRGAMVASLNAAPTWSGYEISDERLVQAGADSAALVHTGARTARTANQSLQRSCQACTCTTARAGSWRSTSRRPCRPPANRVRTGAAPGPARTARGSGAGRGRGRGTRGG